MILRSPASAPRFLVLLAAVIAFCIIAPESLSRGPGLCLWRRLLHLGQCPACGSTRALAAFFHGRFQQAIAFNHNVLITAPLLSGLLIKDGLRLLARFRAGHHRRYGRMRKSSRRSVYHQPSEQWRLSE